MFRDCPGCHGGTLKVKHPPGDRDKISVMLTVRLRLLSSPGDYGFVKQSFNSIFTGLNKYSTARVRSKEKRTGNVVTIITCSIFHFRVFL
jgi:hypothetical protein